jgi:hypothetical protein
MESVVCDPFLDNAIHRQGLDFPTERSWQGRASVAEASPVAYRQIPALCAQQCWPMAWMETVGNLAFPVYLSDRTFHHLLSVSA